MHSNSKRRFRLRWAAAAALCLAPVPAPAIPSAEEQVSFLATPAGTVLLVVPADAGHRPAPVVLALPDAPGPVPVVRRPTFGAQRPSARPARCAEHAKRGAGASGTEGAGPPS